MSTKKTTKANKKNAKADVKASKPKAVPAAKPEPKAVDENTKAKADRLAARREYARAYYKANRDKLVKASSRSHAKRAAEARSLLNEACDMLEGIVSEHGTDGLKRYGDPNLADRLAAYLRRA